MEHVECRIWNNVACFERRWVKKLGVRGCARYVVGHSHVLDEGDEFQVAPRGLEAAEA